MRNVTARPWSAMIRKRNIGAVHVAVRHPGRPLRCCHHRTDHIGLEDGVDTLQHGGDAFESGAGVDVLRGEVPDDVIGLVLDVLHEDQVPDLDMPFVVDRRSARLAECGALVEEDL